MMSILWYVDHSAFSRSQILLYNELFMKLTVSGKVH